MQEKNSMCRKLVVTNQIFLGTRAICYESYRLPKGEVVELTEKQIKDALKEIKTLLDMHIISAGAKLQDGAVVVALLEKPKAVPEQESADTQ